MFPQWENNMGREVSYKSSYLIDNDGKIRQRKTLKRKKKETLQGTIKSGVCCGMQKAWQN
jgi:hypothetical protein